MRDWTRYEEAKRLRDSGMTFKAVGEALGVSAARARDLVRGQENRAAYLAYREANPKAPDWFAGLSANTARRLKECGFNSREDCHFLAADDLQMWRGSVVLPGWEEDRSVLWKWSDRKLSIAVVNEVRAWLGAEPFVPQQRKVTEAELQRAKRMLERHGYKVEPPNGSNEGPALATVQLD